MNATVAAKLKFVLPSLRKLNERALTSELDKLSVRICCFAYRLGRSRFVRVLQKSGIHSLYDVMCNRMRR